MLDRSAVATNVSQKKIEGYAGFRNLATRECEPHGDEIL